ncbi:MAG: hypothetical protein JSU00_19750 [Acidobacteria bacterium]|nr:hypothetical protein [Acidobacteriota bacterium]
MTRKTKLAVASAAACGCLLACGFDDTLREYLSARFWLPLSKSARHFAAKGVKRTNAPFAGMGAMDGDSPVARMREAYAAICRQPEPEYRAEAIQKALGEARASTALARREREEVELIDAKIDMRRGSAEDPAGYRQALEKLAVFLKTARTPEYLSEARGWVAHIHYELGDQTEAGKIYLDELNRPGSNLSYDTLVTSLQMTYGYDGGPALIEHLGEYFDTPEHAAFAIHLATNPHWDRANESALLAPGQEPVATANPPYERLKNLLEQHAELFRTEKGANLLALLGMRVAMSAGDPAAALRIAGQTPAAAAVRTDPDFLWMLASAHFLSHDFAGAEAPLLQMFRASGTPTHERLAAAYGLCGVYQKIAQPAEQIRYALWLRASNVKEHRYLLRSGGIEAKTVYWALSGWDLNMLLELEPVETLRAFLEKYGGAPESNLVRYSLAVRLARDGQYEEAGRIYESLQVPKRVARMRRLAELSKDGSAEGRYKVGEYLAANPERIYFNDRLWHGLQRYALFGSNDARLTRAEREKTVAGERKLKDGQEELWQAYLVLRGVAHDTGRTELGKRAARLALESLPRINERFGRFEEIRKGQVELWQWLAGRRAAI